MRLYFIYLIKTSLDYPKKRNAYTNYNANPPKKNPAKTKVRPEEREDA